MVFALIGAFFLIRSFATSPYKQLDFSTDPGWEGLNNRPDNSTSCHPAAFGFGYSQTTNFAGIKNGEIGGNLPRSTQYRAYYAMPIPAKNLDSRLSASGMISLPAASGSGATFGWFNKDTSYDWRSADYLMLRASGSSRHWKIYSDIGSRNYQVPQNVTGNLDAELKYQQKYRWWMDYDPNQGDLIAESNKRTGQITLKLESLDGSVSQTAMNTLNANVRNDGASFNRFGFMTSQVEYPGPMVMYIDDLTVDGQSFNFDNDPGWEGSSNRKTLDDCYVHHRQDFGYAKSDKAAGQPGEIGGIMWRGNKAWYADRIQPLGLNQALYATGTLKLTQATSDTDTYLGWFNSDVTYSTNPSRVEKNFLVAQIGGPSRTGFRFSPVVRNSAAERASKDITSSFPLLNSHGASRDFWICYLPSIDASGNGRITVGLNEDQSLAIPATAVEVLVPKTIIDKGASFDRFGLLTGGNGGHSLQIYLDNLRYTVGGGDSGPADRCGTIDVNPPTVTITTPTESSFVGGTGVTISVEANDNTSIAGVQFMRGNSKLGEEDTNPPYSLSWDTSLFKDEMYKLTAVARDKADNKTTSAAVNVTVDNKAPTTSIKSPKPKDKVKGSVKIAADGKDNKKLASVQFKVDGNDLGSADTASPYEMDWNSILSTNGDHKLSAVAKDAAGNTSAPAEITVTVSNDNPLPHDGKIIYGSDLRQYLVIDSARHYIQNIPISACLQVRRGSGAPIQVADSVVDGIAASDAAYCYYEQEPGLNFVREAGTATVWLVSKPNGTKRHVGGLCANPNNLKKFKVFEVPAGETEGHQLGYHWFPTDHANACGELPG